MVLDDGAATAPRRTRADARRNTEAVLDAGRAAFAEAGVDASMRDIAARAGVGVGTIYRSYPLRSDLIIAVFRHEVDSTAAESERLAAECSPPEALRRWSARLARFVATELVYALTHLAHADPTGSDVRPPRMVGVLVDGLLADPPGA